MSEKLETKIKEFVIKWTPPELFDGCDDNSQAFVSHLQVVVQAAMAKGGDKWRGAAQVYRDKLHGANTIIGAMDAKNAQTTEIDEVKRSKSLRRIQAKDCTYNTPLAIIHRCGCVSCQIFRGKEKVLTDAYNAGVINERANK